MGRLLKLDVAEVIKAQIGIDIDKRKISLIDPIKLTGTYPLTARLHTDVIASFDIEVVTQSS